MQGSDSCPIVRMEPTATVDQKNSIPKYGRQKKAAGVDTFFFADDAAFVSARGSRESEMR